MYRIVATYTHSLQSIDKPRSRIPQSLHLLLRLALGPVIPPAGPPLRVLVLQQCILQHAPPEQEDCEVAKDDTVALPVERGVLFLIDIGTDDAVQVAEADDKSQRDASFVNPFCVVARPDYGVCDTRIDSESAEEGSGVADSWGCSGR